MAQKRQQEVAFELTAHELALIARLYLTALQNALAVASGTKDQPNGERTQAEADTVMAFEPILQEAIAQKATSLAIKPTVVYWLDSVMTPFNQQGGKPLNITPFTKEDVRQLRLHIVEPFAGVNGSFYQDAYGKE